MCIVFANRMTNECSNRDVEMRSWRPAWAFHDVRGGVREQENLRMFRLGCLQPGGRASGKPLGGLGRRGRWAALWLITGMTVVQSGCQSGPFSNCGSGSGLLSPCGFFGRLSARVFNRSNGGCCGSGVVTDAPVEYAAPAAVVTPGAIPTYPSGPASSSTPSSVFPAPTNAPIGFARSNPQVQGSSATGEWCVYLVVHQTKLSNASPRFRIADCAATKRQPDQDAGLDV